MAIEVDLLNSGVLAEASGEAKWEMNASRVRFFVEIEVLRGDEAILEVNFPTE